MKRVSVRSNIGKLLESEGRTKVWLAGQIGATKQQVSSWCHPDGPIPHIGYIMRIMKATGWTLEQMFEEE